MTVYVMAQLKFKDRPAYDRYQAAFPAVFRQFRGKLLAADAHPRILEGEWPRDKVVLMEFPDEMASRAFHESPQYQAIAVDRKTGADAIVLRFRGLKA